MKIKIITYSFIAFSLLSLNLLFISCSKVEKLEEKEKKPNIILIVLDDAGYSDLGPFGSEINTPSIDKLASEGVMFSQFNVTPNCSSTRASLLTGMDHHRTGMGSHVVVTENQKGKPGYEGFLNHRVTTMAEVLQDGGYYTMMAGKWHLGNKQANTWPSGRGFERSFVLLNGGASHWDNTPLFPNKPGTYINDGKPVQEFPKIFYSSDFYTEKIINYIEQGENKKPFFAYLSFTAPHNPLHAPDELIKKYQDQYKDGWDQLQLRRLEQLKSIGLIDPQIAPQVRPEWIPAWDDLNQKEKDNASRDMAVYAAMIDRLDHNIWLLVQKLKELKAYDNTMILVFSDNGPSKTTMEDYLNLAGADMSFMDTFDNSLENRGLQNSNIDIGPGWAYGIAAPFRLMKGYQSQGGVMSPLIIKPPKQWNQSTSHIKKPVHIMDIMPTVLDAANVDHPADELSAEKTLTSNNEVELLAMQGKSMVQLIKGEKSIDFDERGFGSELFGIRAYRKGNWKILKLPEPYGSGKWQLYNLESDPGESKDLAEIHSDVLEELAKEWRVYVEINGVVEPDKPSLYSLPPKKSKVH
ncbi:arylsulfatase [Lutimonas sp.]|uniref:arylsulfatase n=1 Tax=Lutimonas sp. TaxID=1872403 RepID=UPI003D9B6DC2